MNGWQIFVEVAGRPPVEIRPGESIVGRSRTSQVHIPETTVSRQHARLISSQLGDVTVEDLGSSNGTFVNGEKIEGRKRLADGDRILVGDAEMRVRIVAPVAPTEATVRLTLPPLGQIAAAGGPPPMPPMAPAPPTAAEGPLEAWDDTPPAAIELPLEPLPAPRPAAPPPVFVQQPLPPAPPPPVAAPRPPAPAPPPMAVPTMAPPPTAPPPLAPRPVPPPPPIQLGAQPTMAPPPPMQPAAPPRPPAPPAVAPAPLPPPPLAARPPAPAPPPVAPSPLPPRPIDPPLQVAPPPIQLGAQPRPAVPPPVAPPPPRPSPPPAAPAPRAAAPTRPAPPPAATPPPAAGTGQRKQELGSVTVIDRIPIPEPPPAVIQAAKLERARPAGFWIRVLAALIDSLPVLVIVLISTALTFFVNPALGMVVNLLALPYWVYVAVVMPAQKATTFGKKALGLLIVHPSVKTGQGLGWGVAIIRLLGHFVSGMLLGVGYLLVAFTSQKQGLHDLIAGTRVVRVR